MLVRGILAVKAGMIRGGIFLRTMLSPGRRVILAAIVPVYRFSFLLRRTVLRWYRPAKNKLMFVLTNKATMHVAMALVAAGTVSINMRMDKVRAESLDAFNKSLAYALITQEQSAFIEEYANIEEVSTFLEVDYLSRASLAPGLNVPSQEVSVVSRGTSLAGGGSVSVPIMNNASASIAPREGIETYVVAEGDALSTIAAKFGISLNTILWANNLNLRSTLKLGQQLTILPVSGVVYEVKSGDNLTKIAETYRAESSAILQANRLADASAIVVGQKLMIPGGTPPAPVVAKRPSALGSIFVPNLSTGSSGKGSTGGIFRMTWPATGHYIVRGLSWFHTGVDIDCDGSANGTSTQDNYAAADGVVTFAGPRFVGYKGGYGNLVIIDHGNGLSTRYGHNYSVYVKTGQQVTAGTPIGRCGSTGNSSGTHLHFEVIGPNGSRDYRNPLEYIR